MIRKPRWTNCAGQGVAHCRRRLAPEVAGWLLDSGSLTARLQAHCRACGDGGFEVEVLDQRWGRPRQDEARQLGMRRGAVALLREVRLLCDGSPWVFARTVIPHSSLRGANRVLAHLGNRPLGGFLFAQPSLRRGGMQLIEIPAAWLPAEEGGAAEGRAGLRIGVRGRRSVFYLRDRPLLVAEFFLPAMPMRGGPPRAEL